MTAMAHAMRAAGIVPVAERISTAVRAVVETSAAEWGAMPPDCDSVRLHRRLVTLAQESLRAKPRNWDGAKDEFYRLVRGDADLLWELFRPYRAQAAQLVLAEAAAELRDREKAEAARGAPGKQTAKRPSAGAVDDVDTICLVPPRVNSSGIDDADAGMRRAMRETAAVVRLTLLDTFKVNGQPIGDVTAREAMSWAGSRERDARFVRLLASNLPPDQPIRKFRTGDEAQKIYAEAQAYA